MTGSFPFSMLAALVPYTGADAFSGALLMLAIFTPLVLGLLLLFLRPADSVVRSLAGIGFSVPLIGSILLALGFPADAGNAYAYYLDVPTGLGLYGISLKLGLNGVALPLFLLAGIVGGAAGYFAIYRSNERAKDFLTLLLIMQGGIMGVFASVDVFFFYFFHEIALIPTFIMIAIWGGVSRRGAALEMAIYLTLGAMLSLVGLIALYVESGLNSFDLISLKGYLSDTSLSTLVENNIFALLMFGFGILVSLFPFHSWAPKAYTAAPASVSMLHAGVLKKFGLYGLIQIALPLLPNGLAHWSSLLAWLALGNVVLIGMVTVAQRDLKQLIAYSSVMHMGYAFLGVVSFSAIGVGGAILMMVAHGLSVALLFLLGAAVYDRAGTYDMEAMGGMARKTPALAVLFIGAMLASIGLPGFANFWGEFAIFIAVWTYSPWMAAAAALGIILSAVYGLRAVARIFTGGESKAIQERSAEAPFADLSLGERTPALLLMTALLLVGFFPGSISRPIDEAVEAEFVTRGLADGSVQDSSSSSDYLFVEDSE